MEIAIYCNGSFSSKGLLTANVSCSINNIIDTWNGSLTHFQVLLQATLQMKDLKNYHTLSEHQRRCCVSRKPQYKNVYRRTIEMPQRARSFQFNCCLKVHNAHLKLHIVLKTLKI